MPRYKIKYRSKVETGDKGFSVVRENKYSGQRLVIATYGDPTTASAVARVMNGLRISELGAVDERAEEPPRPPTSGRSSGRRPPGRG